MIGDRDRIPTTRHPTGEIEMSLEENLKYMCLKVLFSPPERHPNLEAKEIRPYWAATMKRAALFFTVRCVIRVSGPNYMNGPPNII